jgi:hypothetical protein
MIGPTIPITTITQARIIHTLLLLTLTTLLTILLLAATTLTLAIIKPPHRLSRPA